MTDDELEALAARLKKVLLDMPGDHAPSSYGWRSGWRSR